jgi:membrane-associated phospholipid phosphatase
VESRTQKLKRFVQVRLSSKGFPGLYLPLALLTLIAATWLFGAIAEDVVTGDPLTVVDVRFSAWLHAHSAATLTNVMRIVTYAHSPLGVSIMTIALSAYWWARRLRYWVLTFILAVFGGMLLNVFLKHLFLRPRPYFDNPILTLTTYSFPSGHTMMATVFYGTLCAFVVSVARNWLWRTLAISIALFMIALVGFSRIYLGVHYLSDVLAAIAEGLAWLASCLITVATIRRGRDRK